MACSSSIAFFRLLLCTIASKLHLLTLHGMHSMAGIFPRPLGYLYTWKDIWPSHGSSLTWRGKKGTTTITINLPNEARQPACEWYPENAWAPFTYPNTHTHIGINVFAVNTSHVNSVFQIYRQHDVIRYFAMA